MNSHLRFLGFVLTMALVLTASPILPPSIAGAQTRDLSEDLPSIEVFFSTNEDYDIAYYGTSSGLEEVEKDFQLIKEMGVDTLRISISWSNYEPLPGVFRHLSWLHDFVDLADEYGITLMPYFCYAPSWATANGRWNGPPRDLDRWYRFVYRIVDEFKDQIDTWEIWNEQDIREWWDGNLNDYAQLLRVGAQAVRDAQPEATVIMGGLTQPNPFYVGRLIDLGLAEAFDVAPVHMYAESWTRRRVDDYLTRFDEMADVLQTRGYGQPLWINEMGYPTVDGRTEEDQANFIRRAVATLMATGHIEMISWYEVKDLRPDIGVIGDHFNYHLGLSDIHRNKKLGFYTYRNLVQLFNREPLEILTEQIGVEAKDQTGPSSTTYVTHHAFRRQSDGKVFLFAWLIPPANEIVADFTLPFDIAEVKEYDLKGEMHQRVSFAANRLHVVHLHRDAPRLFELIPVQ